jgi:hypothetical protein
MGKSHLLRQFQYRCRTVKPRTPVSLVELDQLRDDSPLALVQKIAKGLNDAFFLQFPAFTRCETARQACDFATIRGAVDLREADLHAAHIKAAGIIIEQPTGPVTIPSSPAQWTPEHQATAQEASVRAFFDDLKTHCSQRPVVLMLDAYENCGPNLKTWLLGTLLEQYYFDLEQRPRRLLLVIAGREIPLFDHHWPLEDCQALVKSVRELSKWARTDVEECLRVHGYNTYSPQELSAFHQWIEEGLSPSDVVGVIEILLLNLARSQ